MPNNHYLLSDASQTRLKYVIGRKTITFAGLPFSGQKLAADTLQRNFVGIITRDFNSVSNDYYNTIDRVLRSPEFMQPIEKTDMVLLNTMEIEKIFGFPPRVIGHWFSDWYERMREKHSRELMTRKITEDLMKISKLIRYGIIQYYAADLDGQMVMYHPCCTEEFKAGKDTFKVWIDCDLDYCVYHAAQNNYVLDRKVYTQTYINKLMTMRNCADLIVPNYDSKAKFTKSIIKLGKELHLEEKD